MKHSSPTNHFISMGWQQQTEEPFSKWGGLRHLACKVSHNQARANVYCNERIVSIAKL